MKKLFGLCISFSILLNNISLAIRITEIESGAVLFDNDGFEQDVIDKAPFRVIVPGVIDAIGKNRVLGFESGRPGAFKGIQYVHTSGGSQNDGIDITCSKTISVKGQALLIEWAWYMPSGSDARWGLKGDFQPYKSLWRARHGSFEVYDGETWQVRGNYPLDRWMECTLRCAAGERFAEFTVNGVTMQLEVDNYNGGAPGIKGIFFGHNVQGYYLDGIYESVIQQSGSVGAREEINVDARPELPEIVDITWKRLPNVPRGFQWPAVGMIGNFFISVGGWCTGEEYSAKPGVYPRGYFNDAFAMDVTAPEQGWQRLPDFPGKARMGTVCVVVDDKLYVWGGFSGKEQSCFTDGYMLVRENGAWVWYNLPPIPHYLVWSGNCAIGKKIYVIGACDYDQRRTGYFTTTDRTGKISGIGRRLLVFDTEHSGQGWKELSPCPGTVRFNNAAAAVNGKLYVMGGATGGDSLNGKLNTVIDNWRYDPSTDRWERLADLPIASGNFPTGEIVYKNRYILLMGGAQFHNIQFSDGRIEKSQSFGLAKMFYPEYVKEDWIGKKQRYTSDIFVYDTQTDSFGEAPMLPFNNSMTKFIIRGDKLYLISGETGGLFFDGEYYGHHPDFFLEGTLREKSHDAAAISYGTNTNK
ncbi:MAG: hypothetical protein WC959_00975 [Kiritimatiellales bacterium]